MHIYAHRYFNHTLDRRGHFISSLLLIPKLTVYYKAKNKQTFSKTTIIFCIRHE